MNMTFASCFNFACALCPCSVADYTLEKMIFFVFLLTSFTLGGHVGVRLTVPFWTVHIASTICKRAFSLRFDPLSRAFSKTVSVLVWTDWPKRIEMNAFFNESAVAWTGPLNPLTTVYFGRFRSILNDAYFPA